MSTSFVFVYGTLQRNEHNHHYLASATYVGDAVLNNYALYDLPQGYPGILPYSGSQVQGEVYEVDNVTLSNLDSLEGEGFLYKRNQVVVTMSDQQQLTVFTYVYLHLVDGSCRDERLVAKWHCHPS